ncbi:MAG: hypothetical protein Q7R70_05050 [Candidatus Diapherotrites archaeon]|nr:hypothetical protein [Candidatus Diapherotrites archaeon]
MKERKEELAKVTRQEFFKELNKLKIRKILKVPNEYLVGKERFLGDYYVGWLADILDYQNEEKIVDLGVAYLFGRAFVIAQDRILDNPCQENKDYVIAAPILLKEFLERNQKIVGNSNFEKEAGQVLFEYTLANLKESKRKKSPFTKFLTEEIIKQHSKKQKVI